MSLAGPWGMSGFGVGAAGLMADTAVAAAVAAAAAAVWPSAPLEVAPSAACDVGTEKR